MLRKFKLTDLVIAAENPRTHRDPDSVAKMAESIRKIGLTDSLAGYRRGDQVHLVSGGTRLLALQSLLEDGRIKRSELLFTSVPVTIIDAADAHDVGLASNEVSVPMSPADRFRAYASLHRDHGVSIADIAARYLVTEHGVRQILALAQLAPPVMAALEAGKIGLDVARIYAACSDVGQQEAVWKKAAGNAHYARNLFRESAVDPSSIKAKVVGRAAYVKAGGRIDGDLFEGSTRWLDGGVVDKLFDEKTARRVETFKAQGWGEVIFALGWKDLNDAEATVGDRIWNTKIEDVDEKLRPRRALLLSYDYGKKPSVALHYTKAAQKQAAAAAAEPEPFPRAFTERMRRTASHALAHHLIEHPHRVARVMAVMALRGILPGLQSKIDSAPKLTYGHALVEGWEDTGGVMFERDWIWDEKLKCDRFTRVFAELIELDDAGLDAALACCFVDGLNLDAGQADHAAAYAVLARLSGFDPAAVITPDAAALKALTKPQLLDVLHAINGDVDESWAKAAKKDLLKIAADDVASARWIPPFIQVPDPAEALGVEAAA